MLRRRLLVRLSNTYEAVLKLLLFAKQGRLLLREFHLKSDDGEISAELVVEAPPEKVDWFVKKASGSPMVMECRSLE